MIAKEDLDGIDTDDIGNLEDLLKCSSMKNEEILKYSSTVESFIEILVNRRSQALYKHIDVHSVANVIEESISSIRM